MATQISDLAAAKLRVLQEKLGVDDLEAALDKSLNIANFVADTVKDKQSKLLVESDGKFTELRDIA
jgi:hypothetical protein